MGLPKLEENPRPLREPSAIAYHQYEDDTMTMGMVVGMAASENTGE